MFGAGTVQWSWGLDANHDRGSAARRRAHAAGDGEPVRRHGRPARHAAAGPGGGHAVDRRDGADVDDHRRRPRRPRAAAGSRSRSPARRPSRRRRGRRRRGVHRRRQHLAPRHRPPRAGRTPGRRGPGTATRSAAARSTTAATSRPRRRRDGDRGQRQPGVPVQHLGRRRRRRRSAAETTDTRRSRSARKFRSDTPGSSPASASTRAPRTPARTSAACGRHRHAAGDRHLHGRDRVRLAAGPLPQPGRITANTTYVVSYHAPNGHYAGTDDFFATAGSTARRSRAARRRGRRQRRLRATAPSGTLPERHLALENYWVDVVFNTRATRHDAARRSPA